MEVLNSIDIILTPTSIPPPKQEFGWLATSDWHQLEAINSPIRQSQFLWSRIQIRKYFTHQFPERDWLIPFVTSGNGKLTLPNPEGISFNWSHAKGLTAIAIGGTNVGVDVESTTKRRGDFWNIVNGRFSEVERKTLLAIPEPEQWQGFLRLWTAKEATLKSWGVGISYGLKNVAVVEGTASDLLTQHPTQKLMPLELPDSHLGFVACEQSVSVRYFKPF